jgi:uncharacterized protein (UPF0303 family)
LADDISKELDKIHELQERLIFKEFNSKTAWEIGNMLYERAKKENKIITISIVLNGHRLFYYSFDYFFKSSYEVALLMQIKKDNLSNRYGLPADSYAASGGSVPIILENTGVVGTITLSGMAQDEDHYFITDIIGSYLKNHYTN